MLTLRVCATEMSYQMRVIIGNIFRLKHFITLTAIQMINQFINSIDNGRKYQILTMLHNSSFIIFGIHVDVEYSAKIQQGIVLPIIAFVICNSISKTRAIPAPQEKLVVNIVFRWAHSSFTIRNARWTSRFNWSINAHMIVPSPFNR